MSKKAFLFQCELVGDVDNHVPPNERIMFNCINPASGIYSKDGIITLARKGDYLVIWYVAQSTGLAIDGHCFALKQTEADGSSSILSQSSNHIKISQTSGFAVLTTPSIPLELELINHSTDGVKFSTTAHVKAGIAIYGVKLDDFLETDDLIYYFKETAALHVTAPIQADTIVYNGDIIPFINVKKNVHFPDPPVDWGYHEVEIPLTARYLIHWNVPVINADLPGVVIELQQKSPLSGIWFKLHSSFLPNDQGLTSGTTIADLTMHTELRLINHTPSQYTEVVRNDYLNHTFSISGIGPCIFSTTNGGAPFTGTKASVRFIGGTYHYVDVNNSTIGPDYVVTRTEPWKNEDKLILVQSEQFYWWTTCQLYDEDYVHSSPNPDDYTLVYQKDNYYLPYMTSLGKKVYVDYPDEPWNGFLVANASPVHNYPFGENYTAYPAFGNPAYGTGEFTTIYISRVTYVKESEISTKEYVNLKTPQLIEPSIRIHEPTDLVIVQIPKTEFDSPLTL